MAAPSRHYETPHPEAKLLAVKADRVDELVPALKPWIDLVPRIDPRMSPDALLDFIRKGEVQMWMATVGNVPKSVLFTEICQHPARKVMTIMYVIGNDIDQWMGFLPVIERYARVEGCDEIETHRRISPDYALRMKVYVKELR